MRRFTMLFLAVLSAMTIVSCDNGSDDTQCSDPVVPTLVSPANGADVTGPNVAVDWDAMNATEYAAELYAGKTCGGAAVQSIAPAVTQGSWTGLTDGLNYSWRVRGTNNACPEPRQSAWSECWWFEVTDCPSPAKPALTSPADGAAVAGPSVPVVWQAATNATNYTAALFTGGNCGGPATQTVATTTATLGTWTGLTDGQYSWHVVAENQSCAAAAITSDCWRFTVGTACPKPDAPALKSPCNSAVSRTNVKLSWRSATNATHYRGEAYVGPGCSSTARESFTTQDPKTDATFPILDPAQTYSWRVKAENRDCDPDEVSQWSECCVFNTLP
jgi:hypothetical protein